MPINKKDVQKTAYLARLTLSEKDVVQYQNSLSSVLSLIEQIQSVNTDNVEPLANPLEMTQNLREDVVTESNQYDAFLANAPETEAGLFLVPQVIE